MVSLLVPSGRVHNCITSSFLSFQLSLLAVRAAAQRDGKVSMRREVGKTLCVMKFLKMFVSTVQRLKPLAASSRYLVWKNGWVVEGRLVSKGPGPEKDEDAKVEAMRFDFLGMSVRWHRAE